jgi:hypothetical protein
MVYTLVTQLLQCCHTVVELLFAMLVLLSSVLPVACEAYHPVLPQVAE